MSNKEYDELVHQVVNNYNNKKYKVRYNELLNDIMELDEVSNKCNNKEISFSSMMYHIKFLRSKYTQQLKDIIQIYNEIVFKDFTFKNDLNTMINGTQTLKMWLIRYICVDTLSIDLFDLITEDLSSLSITSQYQKIDIILFNKALKNRKNIMSK